MALRSGDYMNDLVRYIENNLKGGYREDQLRFLLINQGYSRSAVNRAFRVAAQKRPVEAPSRPAEPARVEFVNDDVEPVKKQGFFSKLFGGLFSSKKKQQQAPSYSDQSMPAATSAGADFVEIDSDGNLVK